MTPRQIGRYIVQNELGRGGMAIVYLAHDPVMNRNVAIKVLPHQFTHDPEFLTRFQREIEMVAALEHPRIVPVYDAGEHNHQPYVVMRYLAGGSLSQRVQAEPLSFREISRVVNQIAEGLDEAHEQGIIHRDIKPANIIFDHRQHAYISDFGIARVVETSSDLTGMAVVGTPEFMSPEQAMGDQPISPASDIYSLGVVLFYLLTHEMPYRGKTPMGTALAHITKPVPKAREVNRDLPEDCETVLYKALAKRPTDRFESAIALAKAFSEAIPPDFCPIPQAQPRQSEGDTAILYRGGNISLDKVAPDLNLLRVGLGWAAKTTLGKPIDLDACAFLLDKHGKVPSDAHFVFYNQLISPWGAVRHQGDNLTGDGGGDDEVLEVDLSKVSADIDRIVFTVTIYSAEERKQHFGMVKNAYIRVTNRTSQKEVARYEITSKFTNETAMIFGELYRYKGQWKFRAVGQGFTGGLKTLTDFYGVVTD